MSLEPVEYRTLVQQRIGRARKDLQRRTKQIERLSIATLLMAHNPEQMQRIKMIDLLLQDPRIKPFSFRQSALLVMLNRFIEQCREIGRFRDCRDRWFPASMAAAFPSTFRGGRVGGNRRAGILANARFGRPHLWGGFLPLRPEGRRGICRRADGCSRNLLPEMARSLEFPTDIFDHALPIASLRLPEQARRR